MCARRDDTYLTSSEMVNALRPIICTTLIWSPDHTFPAFSPYKNLAITRTAFYDINSELVYQVVTANASSISMTCYSKYMYLLKSRLFQYKGFKLDQQLYRRKIPYQGLSRLTWLGLVSNTTTLFPFTPPVTIVLKITAVWQQILDRCIPQLVFK